MKYTINNISQSDQSNKGTDVRSLIDAVGNAGVDIEVSDMAGAD